MTGNGFSALGHLARLFAIGRILARHDALFPLDAAPLPPALRGSLKLFAALFGRRSGLREGERLAAAMTELGPSFVKLGQVLSVRPDIVGLDLAADLGRLRDRLPPFPTAEAEAAIAAEFGAGSAQLYASFAPEPVAAASIAQVHFAETADGEKVAVKILRPGIEAAFARDLALFAWLADLAETHWPGGARLRPRDAVATVADAVAIELDLRLEAAAASELAENFAGDDILLVPKVDWQRTGRRVLTLARIEGIPIEDREALLAAGIDLKETARRVIRVFLAQALRDGYFHADMHHGNLFVGADGRLELVDFGIMGRLDMATRRFMAEMLGAFLTGQWRRAAEVHFEAGYVPADRSVDAFAQACRSIGEPILGKPVAEISIGRLLAQLFQITETFGMRTQPHLLLLQKTMVTVEGVARHLDPEINFWDAARPEIEAWAAQNMGAEARLREAASQGLAAARRLPQVLAQIERLANHAAAGLPADGTERRQDALKPVIWLLGAIAALLALNLIF